MNSFPALTASFPLIFLSNLFIAFGVKLLINPGKLSLVKEIAMFVGAFFPKWPNQKPKDPPDSIILDIWALLSFLFVFFFVVVVFSILEIYKDSQFNNTKIKKF